MTAPIPIVGNCGSSFTFANLCLAGGDPIVAVSEVQSSGILTPIGWLDIVSGIFTSGSPPAGTTWCGP